MDTFISFCKENFDLITLAVGILGVFVGILSVIQEMKEKKTKIRKELEKLQAERNSITVVNDSDNSGQGYNMTDIDRLDKKIEELKKKL